MTASFPTFLRRHSYLKPEVKCHKRVRVGGIAYADGHTFPDTQYTFQTISVVSELVFMCIIAKIYT